MDESPLCDVGGHSSNQGVIRLSESWLVVGHAFRWEEFPREALSLSGSAHYGHDSLLDPQSEDSCYRRSDEGDGEDCKTRHRDMATPVDEPLSHRLDLVDHVKTECSHRREVAHREQHC
jgi:hypothetical protein